jgi:hypothetical protein
MAKKEMMYFHSFLPSESFSRCSNPLLCSLLFSFHDGLFDPLLLTYMPTNIIHSEYFLMSTF